MKVQVCTGKKCSSKYSKYITTRLQNDTKFYNWKGGEIEESCCMGSCTTAPNMRVDSELHSFMNPLKASELIQSKI